ncbi:D-alanyl-D-alanine carboxypeptidase (penicillin-binding protein 5/6) [Sporobacter termitidis DSM 10068]|uniref:serine-type D-Ala-D-Ala carboxypeptidase n=1 Tax=Sporobacter termitidis DSM 10068 TaxID=1123282 RepID=A0A1M5UCR8_9FIRM|nr:D-alanyl-D-alanine carboxypeptidase family protein [Sporobacter termitidis]SHH60832.1 D-alanyl-D-alanine carboxypeptidase (penicillin-binding protein 5/6) [Sporobacter termitidis DSM 10068]
MKKCLFTAFLIILSALCAVGGQAASPSANDVSPGNISSTSYILIDAASGLVLCEKNADRKAYPASTTKILTGALALEKGELDQMMTATAAAAADIGPDGMNIGLKSGEKLSMQDLLNATLIYSANDAANVLAENLAATRQDFIDMMNAKAKELGAANTHFTNASGIHDAEHYTTARDLSLMARYAMTLPEFRKIVTKSSYTMSKTNGHEARQLRTVNKFLKETSDYFTRVDGIKSGFTSPAGWDLVSAASNDSGMQLIAVVLGDHSEKEVDADSKALLEFGFKSYSVQTLADVGQYVQNISISGAEPDSAAVVAETKLSAVLPNDQGKWDIKKNIQLNSDIKAPVKKGDVLGTLDFVVGGASLGKVNLVSDRDIGAKVVAYTTFGTKTENTAPKLQESVTPAQPSAGKDVQQAVICARTGIAILVILFAVLIINPGKRAKYPKRRYKIRY